MEAIGNDAALSAQVAKSPVHEVLRNSLTIVDSNEGCVGRVDPLASAVLFIHLLAGPLCTQQYRWLHVPRQGNLKKHGWARKFAILGPDSFILFADDSKQEAPEYASPSLVLDALPVLLMCQACN